MREILRMVNDRRSLFYGYNVMWTNVPEQEDILYYISKRRRTIYVNKGAREGANVVSLS